VLDEAYTQIARWYDGRHKSTGFNAAGLAKQQLAEYLPTAHMLDLAGGTGDMTIYFQSRQAALKRTAVSTVYDLNAHMLEAAQRRLENKEWRDHVAIRQGNAEHLPYADGEFGVCCCAFGLHNMPNRRKVLEEAIRVLKPGGVMAVLEMNTGDSWAWRAAYMGFHWLLVMPLLSLQGSGSEVQRRLIVSALNFPAPSRFTQELRDAGFVVDEQRSQSICYRYYRIFIGVKPQ
ncbi:hypothetical protein EC988_008884, partial [Linderina pennispora]